MWQSCCPRTNLRPHSRLPGEPTERSTRNGQSPPRSRATVPPPARAQRESWKAANNHDVARSCHAPKGPAYVARDTQDHIGHPEFGSKVRWVVRSPKRESPCSGESHRCFDADYERSTTICIETVSYTHLTLPTIL